MLIRLKEDWTMPKRQKTFKAETILEVLPWLRTQLVEDDKVAEDYEPTKKERKKMKEVYKSVKE
jgi:hypothetical protein